MDEKGGNNRDSGIGALGMGMMSGDMDDDDEDPFDDSKKPSNDSKQHLPQQPIPLAAPKPGYAAPVAALNLARPSPTATPDGRQPLSPTSPQMSQMQAPRPLVLVGNLNGAGSPRSPGTPVGVPSTPHPLMPPMTPIQPVFARPAKNEKDVQFAATTPILRGNKESTVLPKRGERGDDFWRRFSMVIKDENAKPSTQKER